MSARENENQLDGADPEAVALLVCCEALKDLPAPAADRVIKYLEQRYFMDRVLGSLVSTMEARSVELREYELRLSLPKRLCVINPKTGQYPPLPEVPDDLA